jgi:hypothetical protein
MTAEKEKECVDHVIAFKGRTDSGKGISDSSDPKRPSESNTKVPEAQEPTKTECEYITGVKLWLATVAVTLVSFLMMFDLSIIVTVSIHNPRYALHMLINMAGYPSNHNRLSFTRRCRLVWQRISFIKVSSHKSPHLMVYQSNRAFSCALQPLTGKIYSNFGSKVSSVSCFWLKC